MTRVKVCGITRWEDALAACRLGVHALGFIFAPSPRRVTMTQAREIIRRLPPFVLAVGVFVDPDLCTVERAVSFCGLDLVQLHGDETPDFCRQ
ncbi:MAG: phosphoribosylanthranilate isomerase, partial [Deltaproteobacteria bacterium]|nr:phosphoribosylanthranilate isomerase [Deltaproteobacteria bacterium]